MECFSCKGLCGICGHTHIKEEQTWATDKWLGVITKELKIKAVLSLKTILDALLCGP